MRAIAVIILFTVAFRGIGQPCTVSFNVAAGIPTGNYKLINAKTSTGGRIVFLCKPAWQLPYLAVGLDLGYQFISSTPYSFKSTSLNQTYRSSLSMHTFSGLLNVRIDPVKGPQLIKPFVDAEIGANDFLTTFEVERDSYNGYTGVVKTNTIKPQFTFAYGAGAGLNIRLNEGGTCYLELRATYMSTSKIDYPVHTMINGDGSATIVSEKTRIGLILPQAGLKFSLN